MLLSMFKIRKSQCSSLSQETHFGSLDFAIIFVKLEQVTPLIFKSIGQVETTETSGYSFSGVKCSTSPNSCFIFGRDRSRIFTALRKIQVGFHIPLRLMPSDEREQKKHALVKIMNSIPKCAIYNMLDFVKTVWSTAFYIQT